MRLESKIAIVSGAASGIGAATARRFGREGAAVVVADFLDGETVAEAIRQAGGQAVFERLDVTDEQNWREVVEKTVARLGKLDILVNNAGISGAGPGDPFDTERWNRLIAVNETGPFFGMKYASAAMAKNGGGSIVNISSIAGLVGVRNVHVGYNASKGGVTVMTKNAAVNLAALNIRVNSVHPGVLPPMLSATGKPQTPEFRAQLLASVPMGRVGEVDEVANAVLFLASDEASYITGAELYVDGGYLAV